MRVALPDIFVLCPLITSVRWNSYSVPRRSNSCSLFRGQFPLWAARWSLNAGKLINPRKVGLTTLLKLSLTLFLSDNKIKRTRFKLKMIGEELVSSFMPDRGVLAVIAAEQQQKKMTRPDRSDFPNHWEEKKPFLVSAQKLN